MSAKFTSVPNRSIFSQVDRLSRELTNVGVSIATAVAVAILREPALTNNADKYFALANGDPARAAAEDIGGLRSRTSNPEQAQPENAGADRPISIRAVPELGDYYMQLRFAPYTRPDAFEPSEFNTELTMVLPLPREIRDDIDIRYSEENLQLVGDLMRGMGEFRAESFSSVQNFVGAAGDALRDVVPGAGLRAGRSVAATLGELGSPIGITGDAVTSALETGLGATPNPNPVVMFTGPSLRDFNFSWTFLPETPEESRTIMNLVKEFKKRTLPSINTTDGSSILRYPNLCRVNFYPWDGLGDPVGVEGHGYGHTDQSLLRLKTCVVTRCMIMYNPDGPPAFFAGTKLPVSINITISVKEVEYMLANDFDYEASSSFVEGIVEAGRTAIGVFTRDAEAAPATNPE